MTEGGSGIQVDKGGFVRIHHTILEVLATAPLRGQQFRCLMFLLRMTYGYNKKEVKISLSEWAKGAKMERHNVWRELQILVRCNVIYGKSNGAKRAMTWGFNKYHEQWNFESVVTDDYKSVVIHDYSSVVADDYSSNPSVVKPDYKSVVTVPHTRDLKDIKTTTTTTTTTESGGSGSFSDAETSILQSWRDNMDAPLTPILIGDLRACIATYGPSEVLEAIGIAVGANNRTLRYVKGVLNRRRPLVNGVNGTSGYANMVLVRVEDSDE